MDPFTLIVILCVGLIALLLLFGLFWLATAWARRRVTERIVIGQITAVVRQNLPLATGVSLAARSEGGKAKMHLWRMGRLLSQGLPLSEAMRIGFSDCSGLVLSLVAAGEQSGQLILALEQAERCLAEQARRRERVDMSVWPYALIVLTALATIVTFLMIAVMPKFKEIFKDFSATLPRPTIMLIDLSVVVATWSALITLVIAIAAPLSLYLTFRPRRVPYPAWTSRVADWVRWHMPGLKRMERGRSMSAMLGAVRMGVQSGMRLDTAARLGAQVDVNVIMRRRMEEFANMLEKGANLRSAARDAGLGEVTGIALASGQRSNDMETALGYAMAYYDAIVSRWWIVLSNLAWPLCTLAMATAVGSIVYALFTPLIALIDATINLK